MYPSRERFRGSSPPRGIELTEPKITVKYLEDQVSGLTLSPKEFPLFMMLPAEIQLKIWEFTIPGLSMIRSSTWEGSTTLWPVLEIPEASLPGKVYGKIPAIAPFPDPEDHPSALHVCHTSRTVAEKHMFRLNDALSRQKKGKWYDYVSRNDIVDLELGRHVIRSLGGPRKPFHLLTTALKRASFDYPHWGCRFPDCVIEDDVPILPNPMFDFSTRKYCVLYPLPEIAAIYRMGYSLPSDYNVRKGYVAMRLSNIEEYIFGSKIVVGTIPKSLSFHKPKDPWSRYQRFNKTKGRPFNLNPSLILFIYNHILHQLAFGGSSECMPSTRYSLTNNSAKHIRDIFVALMYGQDCPACVHAVLPRVREIYGEALDWEKIDILVLSSRTLLETREGHWETMEYPEGNARCENM
ncbi:hypothetical protein BJ170DRAFT_207115 [Xylariales sp. AK1849]|nr:hypothetical protein BJ170DRAFT_207115 [Xylariales sp. AK1849]